VAARCLRATAARVHPGGARGAAVGRCARTRTFRGPWSHAIDERRADCPSASSRSRIPIGASPTRIGRPGDSADRAVVHADRSARRGRELEAVSRAAFSPGMSGLVAVRAAYR
jgi:hypothetical protein